MASGNHGLNIFEDQRGRQCLLGTLDDACAESGWEILTR